MSFDHIEERITHNRTVSLYYFSLVQLWN